MNQPLLGLELFNGQKALGTIEEIIELGHDTYYLVDTRHWTFGERRLIPATSINRADPATAATTIGIERIRTAPDFNPFRLNDPTYDTALTNHYDPNHHHPGAGDRIGAPSPPPDQRPRSRR